jgi:hypothetical protein
MRIGQIAWMRRNKLSIQNFGEKPLRREPAGKPHSRCQCNINMNVRRFCGYRID